MSREEKKLVSAVNALAKATKAFMEACEWRDNLISVMIDSPALSADNKGRCTLHVTNEGFSKLVNLLGAEVTERETIDQDSCLVHYWEFDHDGVTVFKMTYERIEK